MTAPATDEHVENIKERTVGVWHGFDFRFGGSTSEVAQLVDRIEADREIIANHEMAARLTDQIIAKAEEEIATLKARVDDLVRQNALLFTPFDMDIKDREIAGLRENLRDHQEMNR